MCIWKQTIEFRETEPLVNESQSQENAEDIMVTKRNRTLHSWHLCRKVPIAVCMFLVGILLGVHLEFKRTTLVHVPSVTTPMQNSSLSLVSSPIEPSPTILGSAVESSPSPSASPIGATDVPLPSSHKTSSDSTPSATKHSKTTSLPTLPSSSLKGSIDQQYGDSNDFDEFEERESESTDEGTDDDDFSSDFDTPNQQDNSSKNAKAQTVPKKPNKKKRPGQQKKNNGNSSGNGIAKGQVEIPGAVFGFNDIDWSDCIFKGPTCNHYSNYSPIVMRHHRLVFFHCPKNGSTEWLKLFRRMMGYENWNTFPPHDPYQNGLSRLDQYPRHVQLMMMTSPKWTRAIFVRDPMERVLSAYLNKGLSCERYLKKKCCLIYPRGTDEERDKELEMLRKDNESCISLAPYEQQPTMETFPFELFVNEIMEPCSDIHWRPQSDRIHYKNWKFLNFIGNFDNLHDDMVKLLSKVKAYHYAESGWGENGDLGLFERGRSETEGPVTHSHERLAEFYTPEIRKKVLNYVKQDYINQWMNLTKPDDFFAVINEQ